MFKANPDMSAGLKQAHERQIFWNFLQFSCRRELRQFRRPQLTLEKRSTLYDPQDVLTVDPDVPNVNTVFSQ